MKRLLTSLALIFVGLAEQPVTASEPNTADGCYGVALPGPSDLRPFGGEITDFMARALAWNDWTLVRLLLWKGADPEWVRGSQFYEAALRELPDIELVKAAAWGDDDRVLAAIEAGADVNVKADVDDYMSPLVWVATCNHVSTVELLIAHGADVNIAANYDLPRDDWIVANHTPLMSAASEANDEIVEILLKKGANPNVQEQVIPNPDAEKPERRPWDTPLLAAGSMRTAEILLVHGADPNIRRWNGTSALMEAAAFGTYEWCILLLAHGADPTPRDAEGHTAADLARAAFGGRGVRSAELIENWGAGDQKPR